MVKGFETGKWYRWVGPADFRENWCPAMEAWKDGKPRKCERGDSYMVSFEGISSTDGRDYFTYSHCLQYFVEVPAPTAPIVDTSTLTTYARAIMRMLDLGTIVRKSLEDKATARRANRRERILAKITLE